MKLPGVKLPTPFLVTILAFSGCGGGGGGSEAPTITASLAPTSTPAPVTSGMPGPIIGTWKGDGSFTAQSDPNWPLSFVPVPGDPLSSVTKGPPITFTAIGQSVTVTFTQVNYLGVIPTLATFLNQCAGISGMDIASRQFRVAYTGTGSSNCVAEFNGNAPGYYQGDAISFQIIVPIGG